MATLKEISNMSPFNYRVIDNSVIKMRVKSWSDQIEIIYNGKSKFVTRKGAYRYGLAEKP